MPSVRLMTPALVLEASGSGYQGELVENIGKLLGILLVRITRRLVTGTYLIAFEFHTIRVRGYCWSRDLDESLARASQDSERERTRCRPYVVSATFLRSESFSGRGVAWMASTTYIISFRLYVRWWFVIECS